MTRCSPPPQPCCRCWRPAGRSTQPTLRDAMTRAFGATDAWGAWVWKDAYEAAEAAVVLFIRRHGRAMRRHAGAGPDGPAVMLRMLEAVAALEPSHTKRSEEQIRLQQFSTPLPLAYAALQAAAIRPGDVRAGTVRGHRHAGGDGGMRARKPSRRESPSERDRGRPPRPPVPAVPRNPGHRRERRERRRPPARRPAYRRHHEPAVLGDPRRPPHPPRRRPPAPALGVLHAAAGRPARGRHLRQVRSGGFRLEQRLRPPRPARPGRVHHGRRRPRLRAPGHRLRHQAHRARPHGPARHRRRSRRPR